MQQLYSRFRTSKRKVERDVIVVYSPVGTQESSGGNRVEDDQNKPPSLSIRVFVSPVH
jgi:hypothetical protein